MLDPSASSPRRLLALSEGSPSTYGGARRVSWWGRQLYGVATFVLPSTYKKLMIRRSRRLPCVSHIKYFARTSLLILILFVVVGCCTDYG